MLNDLTSEEIKELLNVQKVLNALLDKINGIESQITQNREQIDSLSKTISELSDKVMTMDISTNNDLKQLRTDITSLNQKVFNVDKVLGNYSKQLNEIERLCKIEKTPEESEEPKKKENNSINKALKDVKKLKK